jgi:2,4-dienoyl-CoA reductase-like NADH-dependent reductase (Old Yellow Enzyme family)
MDELFQEASIGGIKVRNRFVRSSTWDGLAEENGEVPEPMLKVYRDLARGRVGLILTGFAFVDKKGKAFGGMLGADDDVLVPGLSKLAGAVHEEGGKVVLQIAHGGSQGMFESDAPQEAPSAVEERATHNVPVEMSKEDINRVVAGFAEAAGRAKEAGFDGVQMHGAHGYLLSQFLSPYSNVRSDEYGGSIENRARAVFEVYEAIRDKVGPGYPVMIKINTSDFVDVGLTPDDSLWVCEKLSEMGMDAIELSGGIAAAGKLSPARAGIDSPEKEAYFREYAKQFKPHLKCPVILVGGLRSLDVIEEIYREGSADFFSVCRPLISEPNLIKRWESGDREPARCSSCSKCMRLAFVQRGFRCVPFEDLPDS